MYCLLSNNSARDPWKFNAIDESENVRMRTLLCLSSKLVVEDSKMLLVDRYLDSVNLHVPQPLNFKRDNPEP